MAEEQTMLIAIGGNSLIESGQVGTIAEQFDNSRKTAAQIAELAAEGWRIALTHGNGPQVGFILRRSEVARDVAPRLSLDMCGADSQGGIGYILQQTLGNALLQRGIDRPVVALITQVEVDPTDPAFDNPTKPIGQFYDDDAADELRREFGTEMVWDPGRGGWRRVVPSPHPIAILESDIIQRLVADSVLTICAGGGGIPIVRTEEGGFRGVEAVVDKDLATALLAGSIAAETLVISTQVERVALNFGTSAEEPLEQLTVDEAERYLAEGQFPPGSMGPKIEASLAFLRKGGARVVITDPSNLIRGLSGETGTSIVP